MGMPVGRFGVLKVFGLVLNGVKVTAASSDLTAANLAKLGNITLSATEINGAVLGQSAATSDVTPGVRLVAGQATTTSATDGVVTGLGVISGVTVSMETDPTPLCQHFTAVVAGQTAGSFLLKGWKAASSVLTSEIAATSFGKVVNWLAVGTS